MLAQLVFVLPVIGGALHLFGFKRSRDLLGRVASYATPSNRIDDAASPDRARRIARLVGIAARHGPYRATCLRQALTLWWLLRRRAIPAELRIGVRKDASELLAHAWVEYDGYAIDEPLGISERYVVFDAPAPFKSHFQP